MTPAAPAMPPRAGAASLGAPHTVQPAGRRTRWSPRSVALIVLVWAVLHLGGLFSPGLLDDVDSVYIEIAREMLQRHDLVTPYVDGIRFFDKPPLMYWLAAGSMHLFGVHDWAARLPLAMLTLALFLSAYALGLRLLAPLSPPDAPDRGGLYAALALATAIGPYLYTRFFIPDLVVTLWLTLAVHLFLAAVARAGTHRRNAALAPMLGFAAVCALSLLTKGFIGLVFPLGFAVGYLGFTRRLRLLRRLHLLGATAIFLALALPWHVLVALRNPAIALPPGNGLPARGGWAWFYLYNEHIARFLSRRIPHDYGQVPIPLFWLLAVIWLLPWAAFLPGALAERLRELRSPALPSAPARDTALVLLLWAGLVLGFFTLSARQEYYSLPALPALALLTAGLLARADRNRLPADHLARRSALRWSAFLLTPLFSLLGLVALIVAGISRPVPPGTDLAALLAHASSTAAYNLSLSHLTDLTGAAMGFFRGPLLLVALASCILGPASFLVRRRAHTRAANLTLALGACLLLLAVHAGLTGFYPTLGSKALAEAVLRDQERRPFQEDCHFHPAPLGQGLLSTAGRPCPPDLLVIDGELTAGSSLLFYTGEPVHLVDGRVNGPWYGSFWPDSPAIFETEASLRRAWAGPRRVYLLTYHPAQRIQDLGPLAPVHILAAAGGKSILVNR